MSRERKVIISKFNIDSILQEKLNIKHMYVYDYRTDRNKLENIKINNSSRIKNSKLNQYIDLLNVYLYSQNSNTNFNVKYKNNNYNCKLDNLYNYNIQYKDIVKIFDINEKFTSEYMNNFSFMSNDKKYPVNNPYPDKSYYNRANRIMDNLVRKYEESVNKETPTKQPNESKETPTKQPNGTPSNPQPNEYSDVQTETGIGVEISDVDLFDLPLLSQTLDPISNTDPFGVPSTTTPSTNPRDIPRYPISTENPDSTPISNNDPFGNNENGGKLGLTPEQLNELGKLVGIGVENPDKKQLNRTR